MNYKEIYDRLRDNKSEDIYKDLDNIKKEYSNIDVESLSDLSLFKSLYNSLDYYKRQIENKSFNIDLNSIKKKIDDKYSNELDIVEKEQNEIMLKLKNKVEIKIKEKKDLIKIRNIEIIKRNEEKKLLSDSIKTKNSELIFKQNRLLEYSKEILELCKYYGIKVYDINIDKSIINNTELSTLYDEYYEEISKNGVDGNIITRIKNKTNERIELLSLVVIIFMICMFTKLFDIIAIIFIIYIYFKKSKENNSTAKYNVLAGICFNININDFMEKDILVDDIEDLISEDFNIDEEEDFKDLLLEINNTISKASKDEDIRNNMSKDISEYMREYQSMNDEISKISLKIEDIKKDMLLDIKVLYEKLSNKEKELKSKISLLGDTFSEDYIINTEVKLGFDEDTFIYQTLEVGMRNIVFNKSNCSEEDLDSFIKVMLANFYCNVRPGYLDVLVYDPNGRGRSLSGFYSTELEKIFVRSDESIEKILEGLKNHIDNVINLTKGKSINDYNRESEKIGRTMLGYKLLIVLSQSKQMEEDETLRSFMEYSASLGVFVWIVSDMNFKNTLVFRRPFQNIDNPIKIDRFEFPVKISEGLENSFKNLQVNTLFWNDYNNNTTKKDDIWSKNTDEFIELNPGYENGDTSKSKGYTLGNQGDIHGICVGTSGAGKSAFINQLIANLCYKYSPKTLSLWLVDFKGTEFNFYLKRPELKQYNMLPHLNACLCTSDPDYSVSLFKAIRDLTDTRFRDLKALGFDNMYNYNKAMRKAGREEECWKRTLVIIDEFQVIFEKTDSKAQLSIKADITQMSKLARAAGVHLLFCSQSMNNTIPPDILDQFTLRFGLRCSLATSQAIMGTNFSGEIKERNGYLYVSSTDDKKKELQKLYRIPYLDKDPLRIVIDDIAKLSDELNYFNEGVITYNETDVHYLDEVSDLYNGPLKNYDVNNLFVLGELMVYSKDYKRSNIILNRGNNEHIFATFSDTMDMVMFFNTIMCNLSNNGGLSKIIFNSQVQDLGYVCGVDKYLDDGNKFFCDEVNNPASLLKIFKDINNKRSSIVNKSSLDPIYIILIGWDKSIGFGVNTNYSLSEEYNTLLQICGMNNIHFIFINTSLNDIQKNIVMSCKYKIAGKVDNKTSMTLLDSEVAYKIYEQPNGYMFLFEDGKLERMKIYQSTIDREIKERRLRI